MQLSDFITIGKRVQVEASPVDNLIRLTIRVSEESQSFKFAQCTYVDTTTRATVDWGDGTVETPYDFIKVTHPYAQPGEYEITVSDVVTKLSLSGSGSTRQVDGRKIVTFKSNAPHLVTLGTAAFFGCTNLTHVELPHIRELFGTSSLPFGNCTQAFDIHFAKANEEAIKATVQYQTDPQLGAPNATILFDL